MRRRDIGNHLSRALYDEWRKLDFSARRRIIVHARHEANVASLRGSSHITYQSLTHRS
jgi:hypothetical protein